MPTTGLHGLCSSGGGNAPPPPKEPVHTHALALLIEAFLQAPSLHKLRLGQRK